ncbi:MAG: ABC transporter permease subunit [Campylobacteraceae bacterium]|jgi:NitT/TauT family transport system permease protein|nr:ABC transporter permease subunit [Campylobacteraceae bacterium]
MSTKKIIYVDKIKRIYERKALLKSSGEVKIELSFWEKFFNNNFVRKFLIIISLAFIWQAYSLYLDNELMFPTFISTVKALISVILSGELPEKIVTSLKILFIAYVGGILLASALTILAITTRIGTDLLDVLTSMFNPLPAIALLPLALLWFGLGYPSIMFVIVHAVTWPIAINIYNGFMGVSNTLRMVGRSYGLTGLKFVFKILIPGAFANILTGFKVGWAFSWRTLIAAELVFGVSSGGGGIGWFIYEKKNQLDIDVVFAGLLSVIIIGVLVENIIFKVIEKKTIIKWGMRSF